MKKSIIPVLSVLALILLLLYPGLSFQGASLGLKLWYQTVLPTLLPFMICSNCIVAAGAVPILIRPFRFFLQKAMRLSESGCYVFLTGLLCGYPIGAKTCSDFLDDNLLTEHEGRYLMAFCNHSSPMFLLGYLSAQAGSDLPIPLILLALYLPIPILAWLSGHFYHYPVHNLSEQTKIVKQADQVKRPLSDVLMDSYVVMIQIGGYIMLFSIFAVFVEKWLKSWPLLRCGILGILEITTGIHAIAASMTKPEAWILIIMATAFGGLSGLAQTKTVMKNAGLSIRHYIFWKALHTCLSGLCIILLTTLLPLPG